MSTGQIRLFAYSEADYAATASLLKNLDPTSAVTVEMLQFWDRYLIELDIHPAFRHPLDLALQRQVHHGVVQSGRDLCRT